MKSNWLFVLAVVLGIPAQSVWAQTNEIDPEFPRDLHGLWWQPADPGWATAVFNHRVAMSSVLLLYDGEGRPTWLASPRLDCTRDMPPWLNVRCNGPMYRVQGSWFGAPSFESSDRTVTEVGHWAGHFLLPLFGGIGPTPRRNLFLGYSLDGEERLGDGMQPMVVQTIDPKSTLDYMDGRYSGLWWNPDESGWGVGLFQQGERLVATLFIHGPDRTPRWYRANLSQAGFENGVDLFFEGDVYETRSHPSGQVSTETFTARLVGRASLQFGMDPGYDPATLNYSIDGIQVTKTIVRSPQ